MLMASAGRLSRPVTVIHHVILTGIEYALDAFGPDGRVSRLVVLGMPSRVGNRLRHRSGVRFVRPILFADKAPMRPDFSESRRENGQLISFPRLRPYHDQRS